MPYFGGYGFFGFYGHYFDLKNLERVKIYASEWRNFVEITDIYENRIYVSCTQGEELVNDLRNSSRTPENDEHRSYSPRKRRKHDSFHLPTSKQRHRPLHFSPLSQILFPKKISIHYLPQRMLCCVYQYLHVKG